ncbi:MAG: RIP metalloprotease RseP [Betaproteobacteria bacterium]
MITVLAFLLALGLLITIHEYGHYRVAVACGIPVLRFSIGFGRPILRWQLKGKPTEFVIGILPLGGYVKMLDEREAPVQSDLRHLAFNNQPLGARAAVVVAGPLANLLLAVVLYAAVSWMGLEQPKAVLSTPAAGSLAEAAGLRSGELVVEAGVDGQALEPVRSFDDLRWRLAEAALERDKLRLTLQTQGLRGASREVVLDLSVFEQAQPDASLYRQIGITAPWSRPVLGEVQAGGAAERAGLQAGDVVRRVNDRRIEDAAQLREIIRGSVDGAVQAWEVERAGRPLELQLQPRVQEQTGGRMGRIAAYVGEPPEQVLVRQELPGALWDGVAKTWDISWLTLRMMGRMLIGEASLKNLSGPLTIADYAGKSAGMGLSAYLLFLAMISVSLGVLNLLPLPILDGGHLMYYLWEAVTGRSVSEAWLDRLQKAGTVLLALLMAIALFNDLSRLLG